VFASGAVEIRLLSADIYISFTFLRPFSDSTDLVPRRWIQVEATASMRKIKSLGYVLRSFLIMK